MTSEVRRIGLTELFCSQPSESALVDLVFVHGLNGHPKDTWTAENGTCWPKDLLPEDLVKSDGLNVRVLTYGFNADVVSGGAETTSPQRIYNYSEGLLSSLCANRRRASAVQRPIVFVAHSLGGLIVKHALVHSSSMRGKLKHLKSVYVSCIGVLFLATPHLGAHIKGWTSYLHRFFELQPPSLEALDKNELLLSLQANSETLVNIERQFMQIAGKFHLFYFYEVLKTLVDGNLVAIAEEETAAPIRPDTESTSIYADHFSITKFSDFSAPGFDVVSDAISRYVTEAAEAVQEEWENQPKKKYPGEYRSAQEEQRNSELDLHTIARDSASLSLQDSNGEPIQLETQGDITKPCNKHSDTSKSMAVQAEKYSKAGLIFEALELGERVWKLQKEELGNKHPGTLAAMGNLAEMCKTAGRYDEAVKLGEQAWKLQKENLEPDHPDTLRSMSRLAACYSVAGRYYEAVKLGEQAWKLQKENLAPDHPDTLRSMSRLAACYSVAGRYYEAVKLGEQAWKLQKENLASDHPDTLISMSDLAFCYHCAGRNEKALELGEQVWKLQKQKLGRDHPDTLRSMSDLAFYYCSVGRNEEALELGEQAWKLQKQKLGPDHPSTLLSTHNLESYQRIMGRKEEAAKLTEQSPRTHEERKRPPSDSTQHLPQIRSWKRLAS